MWAGFYIIWIPSTNIFYDKIYFLWTRLFWAYHSLELFSPCVAVNSWAYQYFSLSRNILSIFLLLLTETCSISWICKYSNLLPSEWQTLRRWFATSHLTLPVLVSLLGIIISSNEVVRKLGTVLQIQERNKTVFRY